MGKLWNYFATLSIVLIVFYIFGLLPDGVIDTFLLLLLSPSSIAQSTLYTAIWGALLAVVGTVIVGSYRADMILYAGLILVFLAFGLQIFQIIELLMSISTILGIIIGGPIVFLFLITVAEWWRGTDYA